MDDDTLWPLDDELREKIAELADQIRGVDQATGGWSSKDTARKTGLSVHLRYENEVDIMDSLLTRSLVLNAPGLLLNALERLQAADAERSALLEHARSLRGGTLTDEAISARIERLLGIEDA